MSENLKYGISHEDIQMLTKAINLPNTEYGRALMTICSKYQIFTESDIQFLTDQKKCKSAFRSDYAMLRLIENPTQIKQIVKDASGYNRYYPEGYLFNGRTFAFTSQLYGYGGNGTHKDNRTPFYNWLLNKIGSDPSNKNTPEKGSEVEVPVSTKEAIHRIKDYIFARGFDYPDGLIENFYLSLKSKPFVILAGTSGTGKTRLVRLFAEAIGAAFRLVSVRPDWSDGSDLFGHTDLNDNFIPGPVCSAFDTAISDPKRPVFLCLDEMNLARVEYYLSDYLSVIESREKENGHIVTEGIAQYENGIPENLYIIGTVNMDETTFPFSKKVLDRANTIEFSYVDLMPKQRTGETFAPQELPNSFLRTEYLVLAADCAEDTNLVEKICAELQDLNGKLVKANAHVGYRVRDEIVFYMLNNAKAGNLLTYEQAMDNEIMQKILPRIQGSSAAIRTLLIDMFKFCMGSGSGIDADTGSVGEQMKTAAASAKYPESARKIGYMMARFEDDGFTSYWL